MRVTQPVSDRTREVLAAAETEGCHLRLTEKLPPKEYKAVDVVLRRLGGTWSRKHQAHVFDGDAAAAIADVISGADIPGTDRALEGFVATPAELADWILRHHTDLDVLPAGARVLEPSAGEGALVHAVLTTNPDVQVTAVEPNPERAAKLPQHPRVDLKVSTFETFAAAAARPTYDLVVMNPPFALPHDYTAWITHLMLAWDMLAPGGRLVSIVPGGYEFRTDRKHTAARDLIHAHGGDMKLPDKSFPGLGIHTFLVWADREVD
jgi:SAM-dependent methyltransferase